MHELAFPLLVGLIILALAFDFLNGLHDAANSIATVVSTRLLSPVVAVIFAALGNFAAYWLVGLHVAETVGKGIVDKDAVTPAVVFGALIGAMFWNVVTWLKGIPSSSSHALIGGLLGAGIAHGGFSVVESAGTTKTVVAIFLSPMIGFVIAMLMVLLTSWLFKGFQPRARKVCSRRCIFSQVRPIRSVMVPTMHRRPWGSSLSCFIRPANCGASFTCRNGW